jgi:hypothetical protein
VSLHHPEEWQSLPFETRCAACHVTDFRGDRHSFEEIGVGCEACHGPGGRHVDSEDRADVVAFAELDAAEEATVCARCHLQGGRSASSGLPYAPAYVPGGSLFDDYHFDWAQLDSAPADQALDAHQKMLIRRAVLDGDGSLRCTSCHELHGLSHDKHRRLPVGDPCFTCHDGDVQHLKEYSQSCNTCEF